MSPQTFRTINPDDRTARSVTHSSARADGVLRHQMTVIASSVTDVVTSAGGWLFDRRMAGWEVDVLVADRVGELALQILGVRAADLNGSLEAISDDPDHIATLAVAADIYAANERVRQEFGLALDRRRAEVALWGDTGAVDRNVSAVEYRLSAAARSFKGQALLAAGMPSESVAATEALFRCGITALAPMAARS